MSGSLRALVICAAALSVLTLAAGASAATRYVVPTGSVVGDCPSFEPCTLTRAVELAEPRDDIALGPGRYGLSALLLISKPDIDVHGAGWESTRLEFSSDSGLSVTGAGSQVRDMRVDTTGSGVGYSLIALDGVTVQRVLAHNLNGTASSTACRLVRATLRDSVCWASPPGASGMRVDGSGAASTVRNATLRGGGFGLVAGGSTADVQNTIVRASTASGTDVAAEFATVNISYSNYETTTVNGATINAGAGNQTRQPQLLDAAGGDFHQAPSSPTREAGTTAGVVAGELDFDREGRPVGAPDIGADEEPAGPLVTTGAATATASSVTLNGVVDAQGPTTTWSFDVSAPGQVRATTTVTLPGSAGPTAVTATLDGLSERTTYSYRLRAANTRGLATGSEASVTTLASPLQLPPPPPPIQSVRPDRTAPVLGSLRLTTRRFAVGRALTAIDAATSPRRPGVAAAPPRGTTLRFKVSEAGSVTIEVQRLRPGRRRAGRCVTPTKGLRRVPRCIRSTTFATLRRAVQSGTTTVPFSGRIGTSDLSRRLPTGSYRFRVRAVDRANNRSDEETIGFTVVQRRA